MKAHLIILLFPFLLLKAQLPDLIPYKKGKLWGYADSTGKIIIEPQWLSATPLDTNELAQVGVEYEYRYPYWNGKKLKKQWHSETCGYGQIINKKGEYILPHQRIAELMLKLNRYGFSCIDLSIRDTIILLQFNESGMMEFDLKGRLLFVTCGDEISSIWAVNCYAYAFNRQAVYEKDGIRFTDRCKNPKSRLYSSYYEENWCFGEYYLFKIHGEYKLDSVTINPDGPAALVKYKKEWLFVDTNDHILYKWKDKDEWPAIADYFHPKDSLRYRRLANVYKPCPPPYYQCFYPYSRFDTSKPVFAAWAAKGVWPAIYDEEYGQAYDAELPYMRVRLGSLYSYMDTFGNLMMPFKYKKLTHYRGYYSLAFDTAWHWIDINGRLLSSNTYKRVQRASPGNNGYPALAYDTAWHWIDGLGNIIYDDYYKKGYQVVPYTGMSLFLDPKRLVYIDRYGREYGE